ncbi:hypothetical protein A3D11_01815 [Candidatus Peribacteria bacterium RIFCSPHIGHO2_02_FULL_49_16]|nr:MAG: hypothetical protein A2880_00925 [Candidatus Peribacteria bacterium RIFCSPHIGHO2_01_FULL_49_38]OGJ58653.1 MAG: hypothetical protein A3D11_01815 [Candidatus Peribacteria bacterium RIFCSPHIGHO2_02_FULL_49_16]
MPEKKQKKQPGKRILIVEDEHPLAHALELKFNHEGFDTVVATNGRQALEELQKENIHAVILDLIMPEMDGFSFLDQLDGIKKTTKVIVVSNLGQKEDEERVMAHKNVAAYFVKSNTPITDIVEKVKSILS